jgi:hypothetical protein
MLTLAWMKLHQLHSKAVGAETVIRRFSPDLDIPMTTPRDEGGERSKITEFDGGWRVVTNHKRTFQLFDVVNADAAGSKLTYRAELCCRDVRGRAYLEMWCRIPGQGEFYSKGVHRAVNGTKTWQSCEAYMYMRRGHQADRIRLCVTIDGDGIVEMRDATLAAQPVATIPIWQRAFLIPSWLVWRTMRFTTLLIFNLVLLGIGIWLQSADSMTFWPRSRGPKLGKRRG